MNKRIFVILVLLLEISFAYSQFSVYLGDDSYIDSTEYLTDTIQDPVFIFNGEIGDVLSGTVLITPTISADTLDFDWFIYNELTDTFDFVRTDTNLSNTTYQTSEDCGIQVRIYNGGSYDTTLTCWVFFNRLAVRIYEYDDVCDGLTIKTEVTQEPDEFIYYEQGTGSSLRLNYAYVPEWQIDPLEPIGEFETEIGLSPPDVIHFFDDNPPPVDVEYTVTVTDSFDNSVTNSFTYETIHTFARYTIDIWDSWRLSSEIYSERDELREDGAELFSAPALVKFSNKSKSGGTFEWIFIDQTSDSSMAVYYQNTPISKTVYDTTEQEFTYFYSGYYKALLISTAANSPCTDTFPDYGASIIDLDVEIDIANSEFKGNGSTSTTTDADTDADASSSSSSDIPNAIIRGSTDHTIFRIRNISLCQVYIKVYDRWGRNVYKDEFLNNIDMEWQGWDGTDKSGSELKAGTYFYVIEAFGCEPDPEHYKDEKGKKVNGVRPPKRFSGAIHIFD